MKPLAPEKNSYRPFIQLLGYTDVFTNKSRKGGAAFETRMVPQQKEDHKKPFRGLSWGTRDSSLCIMAKFHEIFAASLNQSNHNEGDKFNNDRLMGFGEARKAFHKFQKRSVSE